ncbi:hypothetical protein [Roseobacter fucihabitans]
MNDDLLTIEAKIGGAYVRSKNAIGWRLLSSPVETLSEAEVAFIGLNPGGRVEEAGHSRFATSAGSAYETESWGNAPPGQSALQRQVCALFRRLRVKPAAVLSGNLVPFRSASWAALPDKQEALLLGRSIWSNILNMAKPRLIVGMSREVDKQLCGILGIKHGIRVPIGWGKATGSRSEYDSGFLIGLPHLSRFPVINRSESEPGLSKLFRSDWY